MKWYTYSINQVMEKLAVDANGLNEAHRQERLTTYGQNNLTETLQLPLWKKIGKHFVDLLMIILIVAGILKGMTGDYVEMGIIFAVVIINGLIGYLQERKAEESLNGLKQMMGQETTILVKGLKQTIDNQQLVPGDVVFLQSGDIVPADLMLMEVHDLAIEESVLTGESLPVEKEVSILADNTPLGDRLNMAFSGTLVQSGTGLGIVVETGDRTEIGQINQALQTVEKQETPLIKKMNQLNHQIFKGLIFLVVFLLFFTTLRFGMDVKTLTSAVIALIVAVVPEGLPAVLTMILSMGVNEMAKEQAIVKSMPAVETLGAMTVICSDKTGTLTKNQMSVVEVITAKGAMTIDELASSDEAILTIMANCQELRLDATQSIDALSGNPTELALLTYAEQVDTSFLPIEQKIPFSSDYKYMATTHMVAGNKEIMYIKGAPEVLLAKAQLTAIQRDYWLAQAATLAQKGQRVLGLAKKNMVLGTELTHDEVVDIELIGLAGIIDPPKASAIQAVKEAREAGISVKMITGDHRDTAQAIGREIGLAHTSQALEGKDIEAMDDAALREIVSKIDVYARTTPEHKLRIVKALQANGEIVGMTGDGVNDAPALKKADIGIAMGIKGSEVSKQAADMVLADDNFATITKAVKEGRRIFDNLKKTINFFLPTALAQGLIVIVALLTNHPLPLTPVQILWVNMVTTITLSYALGFEPAHEEVMKRQPRNPAESILSKYALFRIIYVSLLITIPSYLIAMNIQDIAVQQTVLLQSIVLSQAVYMINCRELLDFSLTRKVLTNKALWISLGALAIVQGTVLFVPFAQQLVGTARLSGAQHLLVIAIAAMVFILVEVEKSVTKKMMDKKEEVVA
ncbi:HAD-IC family P-type ATPase [Vagococcus zengguangii]|uniref:HAD family hydrolase n=1 Tax=Vagococcus zengguangii TaxID=2571750 RepID=A0A4D7CVA8_9ENTE|nr:HAD-IC family P-type ATPase [Vagococcus zengguangii]QCI87334.1 HAD family hydrolase [Vagococcus zengguangii]TLG81846.1 HAD family hydrolase [Vagococcus zengguangii]